MTTPTDTQRRAALLAERIRKLRARCQDNTDALKQLEGSAPLVAVGRIRELQIQWDDITAVLRRLAEDAPEVVIVGRDE